MLSGPKILPDDDGGVSQDSVTVFLFHGVEHMILFFAYPWDQRTNSLLYYLICNGQLYSFLIICKKPLRRDKTE